MPQDDDLIGVFVGLESASNEYLANIIAPYKTDFNIEIGSFLLIENGEGDLVARVMEYVPFGELMSFMGQKWLSDVALEVDRIGQDIKSRKIRYQVKIKILGTLHQGEFSAGLKNIPHITSKVRKPDVNSLKQIINSAEVKQKNGAEIGKFFLNHELGVKFDIANINSKRTFVFARAGYGKSNLVKLIALDWKEEFGGLLIFDPEGEYAISSKNNKPGIMDMREALFITNRTRIDTNINNVYVNLKLNLKRMAPEFVVPIMVNSAKHENVFFSVLMGLNQRKWEVLVDILSIEGFRADNQRIIDEVFDGSMQEDRIISIKNNLVVPIQKLHDAQSQLMELIEEAMRKGAVVVVDISLLDSQSALKLSSMIVRYIFNNNQREFIGGSDMNIIKANFVIEEAQSVLGRTSNDYPFVELAKEGRKYSLGSVFVTQQPGSIDNEILSQGDNFFVFHMINLTDLRNLKSANAHYSDDIITQILNEPIKGKCYMWTSEQPFVLPVNIRNFDELGKVGSSVGIQSKSTLLKNLVYAVNKDAQNPLMQSIIRKYQVIENSMGNEETKKKTLTLFRNLSQKEKDYLDEKGFLQPSPDGSSPFSVTFKFYQRLRYLSMSSSDTLNL